MEYIEPGYTRVSEILDRLRDRSEIDPRVLRVKGQIGTEVHGNIKSEKSDGIPTFEDYPVINPWSGEITRWEKRGMGYFRSFSQWDKAYKPMYNLMEQRFYDNDLMITGQIDALVDIPKPYYEGRWTLIDFKCSAHIDKEIWNMQAHFYWYLLSQNRIEIEPEFTWIQLKKDGKPPTTCTFQFDTNVLSRCMEEARKYFEEKAQAIFLD